MSRVFGRGIHEDRRQFGFVTYNMDLWQHLKKTDKPIVLYGMGNGADRIIAMLESYGITVSGVFVSDGFVRDKTFHGHKLCSYSDVKTVFKDMTVLVSFGTCIPEVMDNIYRIAEQQELYAPYVPVIGDGAFTEEYAKAHRHDFERVYSLLCDDESRLVFKNILYYRLTGRVDYLKSCESNTDSIYGLLSPKDGDIYMDLGAYNGDTVLGFASHCSNYGEIYAVEPDVKTFRKLQKNTENMRDVKLLNAAIHDKSMMLPFSMQGGRNSSFSADERAILTRTVSVDDILQGKPVHCIKMDVEGSECAAIDGAYRTILQHKPKLAISCYHRIDDIVTIPDKIAQIRGDYKLYMRRMPYIPDWDTLFLFV